MRDMSIARPPRPAPDAGAGTGVGVLDRVVAILDAVESGRARSLAEVVHVTGFSRSTAHRLLRAMEAQDLLGYTASRGYHLGPRFLRLADRALRELPLRELAHPVLERLSRVTGESAQLFTRNADERVCIDAVESASELRAIVEVGAALPVTAGSAGKIFMAWAPEPDRARLIGKATALTRDTPIGDRLARQVASARRLGYAISAGERQPGVGSVSAPVVGPHDGIVAVVSLSGPETRLGRAAAKRHAPAVVAAAREIERALGLHHEDERE